MPVQRPSPIKGHIAEIADQAKRTKKNEILLKDALKLKIV
jgi:hypothetical protein